MGFLYYSLLKKKYFLRKEKAKGIMLQDFKLHYETIIIKKKTVWYQHKNRHINQN